MHQHEHADVVRPRDTLQRLPDRRRDGERQCGAAERLHGRALPVGGELHRFRQAGERLSPVADLFRGDRAGVLLVSEDFALPDREVRVLDGQGGVVRGLPCAARLVGEHQIAEERSHRRTVCGDVMSDEHQDVFGFADVQQHDSHREFGCHIEPGDRVAPQFIGDRLWIRPYLHLVEDPVDRLVHRMDELVRTVGGVGERGAQRLVTFGDVDDRGAQRVDIEFAGQPQRERQIVCGRAGVELVDEPHPRLRERQRDPFGPRPRGQFGPCLCSTGTRGGQLGQLGDSRVVEDVSHADLDAECCLHPGGHAGGAQRGSADVEERVGGTDLWPLGDVAEDLGNGFLGRRARSDVFRCTVHELGLGQSLAVELAVRGERERIQFHDGAGHHVGGQPVTQ